MTGIRIAIAGIGNTACTLLQYLRYYGADDSKPGLWHRNVGGYSVRDIEVAAAFDIDQRKVGLDVSEAAFAEPNVARKHLELTKSGVEVGRGPLSDELSSQLKTVFRVDDRDEEDIAAVLKNAEVDVLVNLISSGLTESSRDYADGAIKAGCSFVNSTPTPIASDSEYDRKFRETGKILLGDDLMSQIGGTVFHRGVLNLIGSRGVKVEKSYQLDVGGGSDTLNTISEDVRDVKRAVKARALSSELPYHFDTATGVTDYVDYMGNNRTSYLFMEAEGPLGLKVRLDAYLRTADGPNGGNILLDMIRSAKAGLERGGKGAHRVISAYGFKSPPEPTKVHLASRKFEEEFVSP